MSYFDPSPDLNITITLPEDFSFGRPASKEFQLQIYSSYCFMYLTNLNEIKGLVNILTQLARGNRINSLLNTRLSSSTNAMVFDKNSLSESTFSEFLKGLIGDVAYTELLSYCDDDYEEENFAN
jgi:hypothetical protein